MPPPEITSDSAKTASYLTNARLGKQFDEQASGHSYIVPFSSAFGSRDAAKINAFAKTGFGTFISYTAGNLLWNMPQGLLGNAYPGLWIMVGIGKLSQLAQNRYYERMAAKFDADRKAGTERFTRVNDPRRFENSAGQTGAISESIDGQDFLNNMVFSAVTVSETGKVNRIDTSDPSNAPFRDSRGEPTFQVTGITEFRRQFVASLVNRQYSEQRHNAYNVLTWLNGIAAAARPADIVYPPETFYKPIVEKMDNQGIFVANQVMSGTEIEPTLSPTLFLLLADYGLNLDDLNDNKKSMLDIFTNALVKAKEVANGSYGVAASVRDHINQFEINPQMSPEAKQALEGLRNDFKQLATLHYIKNARYAAPPPGESPEAFAKRQQTFKSMMDSQKEKYQHEIDVANKVLAQADKGITSLKTRLLTNLAAQKILLDETREIQTKNSSELETTQADLAKLDEKLGNVNENIKEYQQSILEHEKIAANPSTPARDKSNAEAQIEIATQGKVNLSKFRDTLENDKTNLQRKIDTIKSNINLNAELMKDFQTQDNIARAYYAQMISRKYVHDTDPTIKIKVSDISTGLVDTGTIGYTQKLAEKFGFRDKNDRVLPQTVTQRHGLDNIMQWDFEIGTGFIVDPDDSTKYIPKHNSIICKGPIESDSMAIGAGLTTLSLAIKKGVCSASLENGFSLEVAIKGDQNTLKEILANPLADSEKTKAFKYDLLQRELYHSLGQEGLNIKFRDPPKITALEKDPTFQAWVGDARQKADVELNGWAQKKCGKNWSELKVLEKAAITQERLKLTDTEIGDHLNELIREHNLPDSIGEALQKIHAFKKDDSGTAAILTGKELRTTHKP